MLGQYPQVRLAVYLAGLVVTAIGVGVTAYTTGAGVGGALVAGAGTLSGAALAVAASNTPAKTPAGGSSGQ